MIAKKKLPEVEEVHLKSIKGIRPGWWILGGIVLAIIIIFFMLCILPGIVSDSVYVRFDLPTDNTAIYMDGVYLGSSEGSVYRIPEGEHEFSFYILGRAAGSTSVDMPKSIFFTLFSHKTHTISFSIENSEEIEKAICTHFASEVASRSRVLDYSERVSFPPLFSSLAQNASSLCFDDISSLWLYGMLHITSETMYEDYLKGKDILSSSSVVYESDESIRLDETLSLMFSSEDMNETGKDNTAKSIKGSYDSGFFSYDSQSVTMGRSTALSYPEVNEASADVTVDSFSISSSMVTIISSGKSQSFTIRKSPSASKKGFRLLLITISRSKNRAVPSRSASFSLKRESFLQPLSPIFGLSSYGGSSLVSMPSASPSLLSVKHTNLCGIERFFSTMRYKRFTYSAPNFVPHFIHITFFVILPPLHYRYYITKKQRGK